VRNLLTAKELAYGATPTRTSTRTNGDLWTVPVAAEPKRLTTNPAWMAARHCLDGRWIAFRAMRAPAEADQTRLVLYDRASGQTRADGKFDNNVGDFLWAPDSKIYFSSDVDGATRHPSSDGA
jgi:hypothetical protein